MASATPRGEGFLTLLRKRNFLFLWLAQLISMTAFWAANFGLISLLPHSTTLVGLAIICASLPAVIIGAPAGVFVDRRNKRRVLFYSNCLRLIAMIGFVVSLILDSGQLVIVYLITLLISGIGQFFAPAEGSTIPMLVSEDELMPALSLFQITSMLSNALGFLVIGPTLVGLLPTIYIGGLAFTNVESLYVMMAFLYGVCAVLVLLIPQRNFVEPQAPARQESVAELTAESLGVLQVVWHEMVQAWTFVRRRPALFASVIELSFAGILFSVIGQLAPVLVTRMLDLPLALLPFIFAPAGIGLVIGSIFMPQITKFFGKPRTILIGCIALAILVALIPLAAFIAHDLERQGLAVSMWHIVITCLLMFLAGVALDFINIPSNTAMQERTPDWIKGRVLALQLALFNGASIPVILLVGWIGDALNLSFAMYFLAISVAIFGAWSLFYQHKPHPRAHEIEPEQQLREEREAQRI